MTGASRGLGKEIAIQLSREWDKEGMAAMCVYHDSRAEAAVPQNFTYRAYY